MSAKKYVCSICGRELDGRSLVVEIQDPMVASKGKARIGDFICYNCISKVYEPPATSPRKITVTCPRCGEVIDVWL
ncbi:MAG: hypothetical protein QXT64_00125 [Desulfurococcaceae archaeon]|uniref:Zinc finger protein n=1 Tax=Ligamenvirales sp. TaxID=2832923 RepID=A0AAU6PX86_9VIRU